MDLLCPINKEEVIVLRRLGTMFSTRGMILLPGTGGIPIGVRVSLLPELEGRNEYLKSKRRN